MSAQHCGCIMTQSAGPQTQERSVSALTLRSPRLPAHSPALVITFSPHPPPTPTLPSVLFHLPPKTPPPPSSSQIPPFLRAPPLPSTLADTPRTPRPCLSPPSPQLACLCAATQPISARPAGAGSLTQPLWRT